MLAGGAIARARLGSRPPVILQLHHRYRHPGGEERAVEDLAWLIRAELGEDVEVLARASGARVVLHLHNYRLVCAVATCFTHGEDCTRCHGRNTLPGLRLNCRG